jgi:hypothetical protein
MESILVYAKPKIQDVYPYIFVNNLALVKNTNAIIVGSSFYEVRNVYLSASNPNLLSETSSFFNPFSGIINLSAYNPPFNAVKFYNYTVETENYILLNLNLTSGQVGYIDIIVENEAGYSVLSRDSRIPFLSAYQGAIDIQKPAISGIKVINH